MFLIDILGWLGAAGVLGAYALATKTGMTVKVQALNLLAAGCLLSNAAYTHSWPFVALNFSWVLIAYWGLATHRISED